MKHISSFMDKYKNPPFVKYPEVEANIITIEVYGGVVTNVAGLPEGYGYEIIDHDNIEEEAL